MTFKDYANVFQMLSDTAERWPNQAAYRWFTPSGGMESVTWKAFRDAARQVGKALMALDVQKGDKVNILSYSCYQWVLADMGIVSIGACTVGIYQSNLARDCRYIIDHSDAVVVFAEDDHQLDKLLSIRDDIPDVRKVILFKGEPQQEDDWVMSFDAFLALADDVGDTAFEERAGAVRPEDPAGIVYTSGTTGVPKGAVLTHDNITFTAQSVQGSTDIRDDDEVFLFLPLAHVFARTCVYATLLAGRPTTFARSMDTIIDDIAKARPHWFASVPRIYEKVYSKVVGGAEAKGGLTLKIFDWARHVGARVSDHKLANKPLPRILDLQYRLATRLVFSKLQAAFGGRVRWCISGGAPLNPDIARFFHAAGILILEGIGMTENTSFTNLNRIDNYRFGWVGQPGPGIEQKIAADGEILYRGRNVMKEYYKMPEETAETIEPDGWQHTGDLGEIDDQDFLRITGRKKDLIITAGGKNIAPARIEGVLATSRYLNQVCVIGDRRKYLTALVTLDMDNIQQFASENRISYQDPSELEQNDRVRALIDAEITEKNKAFASFETIKRFTIVPEFTIENGMLTPTLKVKRNVVAERFKAQIDAMYPAN